MLARVPPFVLQIPCTLQKFPQRPTSHFTKTKFHLHERSWPYQADTHWNTFTHKHNLKIQSWSTLKTALVMRLCGDLENDCKHSGFLCNNIDIIILLARLSNWPLLLLLTIDIMTQSVLPLLPHASIMWVSCSLFPHPPLGKFLCRINMCWFPNTFNNLYLAVI